MLRVFRSTDEAILQFQEALRIKPNDEAVHYNLGLALATLVLQHLPRRHVQFRHAFLGALVCTLGWWVAKLGFGYYLKHTPTWGVLYGSLGSVMAALVFLYYSCAIFMLGAEVTAAFYWHSGTGAIQASPGPDRPS